jgi:hypothetical protein
MDNHTITIWEKIADAEFTWICESDILNPENRTRPFVLKLDHTQAKALIIDWECFQGTIEREPNSAWKEYYATHKTNLIALLVGFFYQRGKEDSCWFAVTTNYLHHLQLVWHHENQRANGKHQAVTDKSYTINESWFRQEDSHPGSRENDYLANQLYERITSLDGLGLSPSFPLWNTLSYMAEKTRTLVIKIPPTHLRLSLLPFEAFTTLKLGQFGYYKKKRYILNEKNMLQSLVEEKVITRQINQYDLFISKTLIIINDYEHFEKNIRPYCEKGVTLIEELIKHFKERDFPQGKLSIRYLYNSCAEDLLQELNNENTWFVIANFHTVLRKWTLNEKWNDTNFYEKLLQSDLSHIRKLRAFHCYSILDYDYGPGITSRLQQCGVVTVEGSTITKAYLEHLFCLVYLFVRSGLRHFINDTQLIIECEEYLKTINNIKPGLDEYL